MFSFYEDGHQECCRVRKVRPLRRQLSGLKAWITGQRKDQSPGTRSEVPVVQTDPVFEGLSSHTCVRPNKKSEIRRGWWAWQSHQVQSTVQYFFGGGLEFFARDERACQCFAPTRLRIHRMRAMHPSRSSKSARARRKMVVGRRGRQRVWSAFWKHQSSGRSDRRRLRGDVA